MFRRVRLILEMIKFSHTVFALPFALLAAAMATRRELSEGRAWRPLDWLGILLCMVLARSAAMAFNRLADERLDAANPRTAGRALPAGLVNRAAVVIFTALSAAGFIAATALFWVSSGNLVPLWLSVPVLVFICGYSLSKRFTAGSHFWLGAALMLAPLCTWIAIRGRVEWPPVLLGAAVLFWVAGFDIIYSCQDAEFDRQAGLFSIPARLGLRPALLLAAGSHAIMVCLLAALPAVFDLGWVYWTGVAAIALLLFYEHSLVRPDDLRRVNVAFFHVNSVVSVGLLLTTVLDMLV